MTAQNLLVELFVEELPPKALKKLGEAFAGTLFEQLKSQGLTAADSVVTPYATPRRLASSPRAAEGTSSLATTVLTAMPSAAAICTAMATFMLSPA